MNPIPPRPALFPSGHVLFSYLTQRHLHVWQVRGADPKLYRDHMLAARDEVNEDASPEADYVRQYVDHLIAVCESC